MRNGDTRDGRARVARAGTLGLAIAMGALAVAKAQGCGANDDVAPAEIAPDPQGAPEAAPEAAQTASPTPPVAAEATPVGNMNDTTSIGAALDDDTLLLPATKAGPFLGLEEEEPPRAEPQAAPPRRQDRPRAPQAAGNER